MIEQFCGKILIIYKIMRLFYTVSSKENDIQSKPNLSIGGYKSITPIPNSEFGNLFGDISMYTVRSNNQNQYIGLILNNETGKAIQDINIYFDYPSECYSSLKLAAVDLVKDANDEYYMERVGTINSKPLYAEFFTADGVANEQNIGGLGIGEKLGLWIERIFDLDTIKADQNNIYEVDPTDPYRYLAVELDKVDDISIVISWTEA